MVGEAQTRELMVNSGKDEIFRRIRRARNNASGGRENDYAAVAREYRKSGHLDLESRLNLFAERLADYEAIVYRCSEVHLPATIARVLAARSNRRLLVPQDFPQEWLPRSLEFVRDSGLTFEEIDRSEGVLTGCIVAVALTGTIMLRHSIGEGRRALTLIPDYHVCVVHADQVVETVPEGIRKIREFADVPITTISGPSATADIEMTRIKGVHGPRVMDVILVTNGG
jgi:L-lactate dehydrogenase complex protein LldG